MSLSKIFRIAIIGPESTGKSTLANALAIHYATEWVEEYARTYLEGLSRPYNQTDLSLMAQHQMEMEENKMVVANRLLFMDTNLQVIKVWSEHKYSDCAFTILQSVATTTYDAYILTNIDLPWEYDVLREHPEQHWRAYFFNVYKDIVVNENKPFLIVSGTHQKRLNESIRFLNEEFGLT